MKNREKDTFEELFRSKLQRLEMDTESGDWELIEERLPERRIYSRKYLYWVTAMAAALLLLFVIGTLFISLPVKETLVEADKKDFFEDLKITSSSSMHDSSEKTLALISKQPIQNRGGKINSDLNGNKKLSVERFAVTSSKDLGDIKLIQVREEKVRCYIDTSIITVSKVKVNKSPIMKKEKEKRWSFGMGGGSVTMGSSNALSPSIIKSAFGTGPGLLRLGSSYIQGEGAKTNVSHKYPFSVGLGVSYRLNNRFSLHSGLNYTFLSSEWERYAVYRDEVKQRLHFVGIPLSLSYKIAEWKDFQFYTAAGGMVEMNVAGKQKSKIFAGEELVSEYIESVRMRELLWSLNACIGVTYPLCRFLSLYAEAGIDYYIDNGSSIETIRSEKPFNVNLQAGFRFGF